jgi:hypothetical protein
MVQTAPAEELRFEEESPAEAPYADQQSSERMGGHGLGEMIRADREYERFRALANSLDRRCEALMEMLAIARAVGTSPEDDGDLQPESLQVRTTQRNEKFDTEAGGRFEKVSYRGHAGHTSSTAHCWQESRPSGTRREGGSSTQDALDYGNRGDPEMDVQTLHTEKFDTEAGGCFEKVSYRGHTGHTSSTAHSWQESRPSGTRKVGDSSTQDALDYGNRGDPEMDVQTRHTAKKKKRAKDEKKREEREEARLIRQLQVSNQVVSGSADGSDDARISVTELREIFRSMEVNQTEE